MFEVTTLQVSTTTRIDKRRQQILIERIKEGHVYIFSLGDDDAKYKQARALLLDLEESLHDAGYFTCLYPGGIPENLLMLHGCCIACPVPAEKWDRASCPAWGL